MKYFVCTLLMFLVLYSCKLHLQDEVAIQWTDDLMLPPLESGVANPGIAGALAGVCGNYLLIAGGANFPDGLPWQGGKKVYHTKVYVYHFDKDQWHFQDTFHLDQPRGYGASVSLPDGVLCLGGENSDGILQDGFFMQFDSLQHRLVTGPVTNLPFGLTNLSAVSTGDRIYVAGGDSKHGVSDKMFVLQLADSSAAWKQLASIPKPVSNFVMVALRDALLIIGGRCRQPDGISKLYNSVYAYDPGKDEWTEKQSLPYALSAGSGVAYDERKVFLIGGDKGETFHKTELLIREINNEQDSSKKAALTAEKNLLQEGHPGFSNVVLSYDVEKDEWSQAGQVPFAVPVTTTAVRFGDQVILASGEIRAGVRTPHILTGHLKSR